MNKKLDKKELREAFNSVDPAGIFFDENVDEYDPEIDELLKQDIDFTEINAVQGALSEILHRWFEGIEIDETKLKELAQKICSINQLN